MASTPDIQLSEDFVTITGIASCQDGLWASGINVLPLPVENNAGTCSIGNTGVAVSGYFQNMQSGTMYSELIIQTDEIAVLPFMAVNVDPSNPSSMSTPAPAGPPLFVIATVKDLLTQIAALTTRVAALEAKSGS